MADAVITIQASDVLFSSWLRTSYIALSNQGESGKPLIDLLELGRDEKDIFNELLSEAAKDILKLFTPRQDGVIGTPFSLDVNGNIIYRFSENTPALSSATQMKLLLTESVKQAIYTYVAFNWLNMKGHNYSQFVYTKYLMFCDDIKGLLYQLHD